MILFFISSGRNEFMPFQAKSSSDGIQTDSIKCGDKWIVAFKVDITKTDNGKGKKSIFPRFESNLKLRRKLNFVF